MNAATFKEIRTRFAPSPTGSLHVGGARTALFNWLFAKKQGGKFLLRIEDTDVARSSQENIQQIIDDLQWLGLNWDEEIVFQSQRIPIYQQLAQRLVETGQAYYCFCTPQELEAKRKKGMYLYDATCRKLSAAEVKARLKENRPHAIRLKAPAGDASGAKGEINWVDAVHGEIRISRDEIDDFILLRSDGSPTYQLAVVVDDHEMNISHVIRGDDHIPNTPKQILLYQAFDWQIPTFGHVPLILGPDNKRLSKRHGATALGEFREKGYLPQALLNYLSLLGWSPGDDSEIMSAAEINEKFSLKGISKKAAVFDQAKLQWMNGHYIRETSDKELASLVQQYLPGSGLPQNFPEDYLTDVVRLMKPRAKLLTDFVESARYFYEDPHKYDAKGVNKYLKHADIWDHISEFAERLAHSTDYHETAIEALLRSLAEEKAISAAKIIHPIRLALTGATASPGLFEMMVVLGKETVLRRLKHLIDQKDAMMKQIRANNNQGESQ